MRLNASEREIQNILRGEMANKELPLKYEDDYDIFDQSRSLFSDDGLNYNCYSYALGLQTPDDFIYLRENKLHLYEPGTMSCFRRVSRNIKDLVKGFLDDCTILELECIESQIDAPLDINTNKVAIYILRNPFCDKSISDFHFIRQNTDGSWSHKLGYRYGVSVIQMDNIEYLLSDRGYSFLGAYTLRKKK